MAVQEDSPVSVDSSASNCLGLRGFNPIDRMVIASIAQLLHGEVLGLGNGTGKDCLKKDNWTIEDGILTIDKPESEGGSETLVLQGAIITKDESATYIVRPPTQSKRDILDRRFVWAQFEGRTAGIITGFAVLGNEVSSKIPEIVVKAANQAELLRAADEK